MPILDHIPVEFDIDALADKLRIESGSQDHQDLTAVVAEAASVVRPKAMYEVAYVDAKYGDAVEIEGVTFESRVLRANLDEVERVFPYVATCGTEVDEVAVPAGDFLQEYWLDTIKEVALRAARRYLNQHLRETYALGQISSMSPGSGTANIWPIEQQEQLFSLLGDTEELIGVRLTGSYLMTPIKTVSGILFPTEVTFQTCQLCPREPCPNRRAPYAPDLVKAYAHA